MYTRLFLKLLVIVAAVPGSIFAEKVVIIGAGVSGLSAANRLCSSGMCDVTILEAEDRVGGRIYTKDVNDLKIELGAQWIHGKAGNAVYELIQDKFNLEDQNITTASVNYDPNVYFASGKTPSAEVLKLYYKSWHLSDDVGDEVVRRIERENLPEKDMKDITVLLISEEIWQKFYTPGLENVTLADATIVLNNVLNKMGEYDGGTPDKVGSLEYYYFEDQTGNVYITKSYQVLITLLMEPIPASVVKLKSKVLSVIWKGQNDSQVDDSCHNGAENSPCSRVEVEHLDENGDVHSIEADHVICTASLGYLKKHHGTLFEPNLSQSSQNELTKMKMGTMNKGILYYKTKFWEKDLYMQFLWDSYDGDIFADENHWCRHIDNIYTFQDQLLVFWLNEKASEKISSLSNEEIGNTVVQLMQKFNPNVTKPDDVIITKWGENENFLGSYSYTGIGETLRSKEVGFQPLCACGRLRVLFAGEATHPHRFSTVDGAYLTGLREADRLLDYWNGSPSVSGNIKKRVLFSSHFAFFVLFFGGLV